MQSLHVDYNENNGTIEKAENASPEPWNAVCERFDNDVRRIKDATDTKGYTALYACFDENNQPVYYLVEEDETLLRLKHKTLLGKLGRPQP